MWIQISRDEVKLGQDVVLTVVIASAACKHEEKRVLKWIKYNSSKRGPQRILKPDWSSRCFAADMEHASQDYSFFNR
jgi:hypothetical protein